MEHAAPVESAATQGKNPIEALSKDEIINKYKGLLSIAKKAKQAKDELTEENRKLREALATSEIQKDSDKKALLTMKEMLEQFTESKLQMATELSEVQNKRKAEEELVSQLRIENESLRRQLDRLSEDNESLLSDIDSMEGQLKQVNLLGIEQKKHLEMLELEVHKLKEAESQNVSLQVRIVDALEENKTAKKLEGIARQELEALTEKYQHVKEVNAEQRRKFNVLKERFVDVHRKLKQLKECKRVLLETQHEYGDAVSKWQREIIRASRLLCAQMNLLKTENEQLMRQLQSRENATFEAAGIAERLGDLQRISELAWQEFNALQEENKRLRESLAEETAARQNAPERMVPVPAAQDNQLQQQLADLTVNLQEIEAAREKLLVENNELRETLLRQELAAQEQQQRLCDEVDANRRGGDEVQTKLQELVENMSKIADEKETCHIENVKLRQQLDELAAVKHTEMVEREQLQAEVSTLRSKLRENERLREDLEQIRNVIKAMEEEKVQLLQQMRHQQKVAAEEEEQHQQRASSDSAAEQRNAAARLQELQQSYDDLLARYERKEREHGDLLGEMRELNEALKGRGDVISRQQEKQQELHAELKQTSAKLAQLEQRLDEKEQLLSEKELQLSALGGEIEATRLKVTDLEAASARSEQQVRALGDELQSLRTADAAAECQSDVLSTSTISRADELSRLRELDEGFEEKYNKLRGLAVKLKKKLQEQSANMEDLQQQLHGSHELRRELEERQQRIDTLQQDLEKQQQLAETSKAELQRLKSSRKQVNVLNLEIEAAEKSLSEATAKLTAKAGELEALNEALNMKEGNIVQLRQEIAILEAAKEAECTHAKELKAEVDRLQLQLKDAVHGKQSALVANKELEHLHERTKLELEEASLQLAQSTSSKESALSAVWVEKEALAQQLRAMEGTLRHTQSNLSTAERTLDDLRVEYLDYKVKAQTVLRKNQSKDSTKERELQEELVALRVVEQQLQEQAKLQLARSEESDKQVELLRQDNEGLQRRSRELMQLVEELRQQNEQLVQEGQQQLRLQQEALRNHRQQIEALDACHKEQLQQVAVQMQQQQADHTKPVRLPPSVGAAVAHAATGKAPAEQSKIDFLLMEREDAEGSEEAAEALATAAASRKISNASRRSQHDFMPLDELLNVSMAAISDTVTSINANSHNLMGRSEVAGRRGSVADVNSNVADSTLLELQATKERLHIQESRGRHLTALLAENEQDLAKLTQLNDMLKEELRRQERSVEREQHMQNSEYLKNVFMKFLTLNAGDERTRLVPVLNTILRLNREEVEMLNCVAKGQKLPTEATGRGWSFLTSWGRID